MTGYKGLYIELVPFKNKPYQKFCATT